MTQDELFQEELRLEAFWRQDARNNLKASLYDAERYGQTDTQNVIGKAFINHKAYALKEVIQAWLEDKSRPKAGVKPNYLFTLQELQKVFVDKEGVTDWNTIANICTTYTLSAIINTLQRGEPTLMYVTNTGKTIGVGIDHEYKLKCFDLWLKNLPKDDENRKALNGINTRVGEHYRVFYLKQAMKKCKYNPPSLNSDALRSLGVAFIALAEDVTGYFTLEHEYKEPESLVPTLHFMEAWQRNEDNLLEKACSFKPMVLPPAPWTSPDDGGYYGEAAATTSFLRLKYLDTTFGKMYAKKLAQLDMSDVYKAVNSIQATPYIINGAVLDVLKECRARGYIPCASENNNIIHLYDDNAPVRPTENASEAEIKTFKKKYAAYCKNKSRHTSLQNRANSAINTAINYRKYDKIYFPWNMDFRGRIYPIPLFSPQGDDLTKGLLLFADTPPCQNEDDWKWLAITGANLAGVDKVSYDDRVAWVKEHEEAILASAADPMGYQWWLQQDEPVQMLAFCFEWQKAHEWIAEHGSIVGFVTGLPYAQDGTCSGLQHFSAILRDPIGGKAVNLIPQDKPNDIYAQVAEKVKLFLKEDAMNGTLDEWDEDKLRTKYGSKTLAQIWLNFGINRKVTKRPTMTLAYGAKKAGYTAQIMEDTIKKARREQGESCVFTDANCFQCAQYMASKIWDAVSQTVVKAVEGMDWLHKCAKLVTKNSNVVTWITPLGLLLQQSYTKYNVEIVKLRCAGKRFRIYNPHQTGEIDKTRQSNGIAPNFIHSMDACHLQMTVCRAKDTGINHFAMIHDSYGCPMSQAQLMFDIVRQAFIDMYTEFDVLEMFRDCLQPLSNKKLPAPPKKGGLDLTCVKDSKYIFC